MKMNRFIILVCCIGVGRCMPITKDWYYDEWCGGSLEFLDDSKCVKKFPVNIDREWYCPIQVDSVSSNSGFAYDGSLKDIEVDTAILSSIVNTGANVCVVLTKRVKTTESTKLYNKYFCGGVNSATEVYETWSSSKIFAIANAADHMRTLEKACAAQTFGIDSTSSGKHGLTPMGDLATIVCSYDHTAGYSSNSLSSYFHDFGWRDNLHNLVGSDWLGLANLTLGGNYGEASPGDLGYSVTARDGVTKCAADKDPWPKVYDNSLSALAAAEMTRRIVQFRDIAPALRFPGMQWQDAQAELMGAATSQLFPGLAVGGMMVDTGIFLQSSLNMTTVSEQSRGKWRIYSKLGAGWSTSRYRGEIVTNAYGCLPVFDSASDNEDITANGWEFAISIRGSVPQDSSLTQAQSIVINTMRQTIAAILDGRIQ